MPPKGPPVAPVASKINNWESLTRGASSSSSARSSPAASPREITTFISNTMTTFTIPTTAEALRKYLESGKPPGFDTKTSWESIKITHDDTMITDFTDVLKILDSMITGATLEEVVNVFVTRMMEKRSMKTFKQMLVASVSAAMGNRKAMAIHANHDLVKSFVAGTKFMIGDQHNMSYWTVLGHLMIATFPSVKTCEDSIKKMGGGHIWSVNIDNIPATATKRASLLKEFKNKHARTPQEIYRFSFLIAEIAKEMMNKYNNV